MSDGDDGTREWRDRPPGVPAYPWPEIVADLYQHRGEWTCVQSYAGRDRARAYNAGGYLRRRYGVRATVRQIEGEYQLWASAPPR